MAYQARRAPSRPCSTGPFLGFATEEGECQLGKGDYLQELNRNCGVLRLGVHKSLGTAADILVNVDNSLHFLFAILIIYNF